VTEGAANVLGAATPPNAKDGKLVGWMPWNEVVEASYVNDEEMPPKDAVVGSEVILGLLILVSNVQLLIGV
jgi:hypothetical protein